MVSRRTETLTSLGPRTSVCPPCYACPWLFGTHTGDVFKQVLQIRYIRLIV